MHFPSQKPVILKLPQYESFSSLSDIMKKIPPRQSTPGRGSRAAASELSRSMLELSTHNQDRDDGRVPVPRFKASVSVWMQPVKCIYTSQRCFSLSHQK